MSYVDIDIQNANTIISKNEYEPFIKFSNLSPIYRGTNENINGYTRLLGNNNSALSVVGSGDQILNLILYRTKDIDAFDISSFTRYFLNLKISAVKEFNYDEYLRFFYSFDAFDKNDFDRVLTHLDDESKYFWSTISKGRDTHRLYSSYLFSRWVPTEENAIERNPYLVSRATYKELKDNIEGSHITFINDDIYKLAGTLKKDYDFINLSNICMYADTHFNSSKCYESFHKFGDFVKNLRLTPNGKALNYLLDVFRSTSSKYYNEKVFTGDEFEIDYVKGDVLYKIDGVSVYRKKK